MEKSKGIDLHSLILDLLGMGETEIVAGSGIFFTLRDGRCIMDMWGAYGANALGYNNPVVINSLRSLLDQQKVNVIFPYQRQESQALVDYFKRISSNEVSDVVFTTCGSTAVDTALKIAYTVKPKKEGFYLSFSGSFHGKTIGTLSISGQEKIKQYSPLLHNVIIAEYNNTDMFRDIIKKRRKDIIAIIIEVIQSNGGIIEGKREFLEEIGRVCKEEQILLIVDEVSTGLGRVGRWFAYQDYQDLEPDLICIGKHLGGGLFPVGACLINKSIYRKIAHTKLSFMTTFSEQAIAHSIAIKVLQYIDETNMLNAISEKGERLIKGLRDVQMEFPDHIKDIRGRGLLIGIELYPVLHRRLPNIYSLAVIRELYERHNILVGLTSYNPSVIRLHPPFLIAEGDIKDFIAVFREVISISKGKLVARMLRKGLSGLL